MKKYQIPLIALLFGVSVFGNSSCVSGPTQESRAHIENPDGSITFVGPTRMEKTDELISQHREALNRTYDAF